AVASYAAIAKEHPEAPQAPHALFNAAWAAMNLQQYDAALSHAKAFAATYPKHELATSARGIEADSLLNLNKPAEAAALYRELIEKNRSHAERERWQILLAWALRRDGRHAEIVALLEPIMADVTRTDRKAEVSFLLGLSRFAQKQYGPALDDLK